MNLSVMDPVSGSPAQGRMGISAHPGSAEPAFVSCEGKKGRCPIRSRRPAGRARTTRPSPLRTAAIAVRIDPMPTTSHTPNIARAHADAGTSLTVLEGTLSQIAADSAVAADRLHEA